MQESFQDTGEVYRDAYKRGRRFTAEHRASDKTGLLEVFNEKAAENTNELYIGNFEVPLSKIRGTFSQGRQSAFAGNFMPLLSERTEFAQKWKKVYSAHINEGLRDPVQLYEYMGYYYVREGNKRISVLKYSDAYSYNAEVIRLLPPRDDGDEENAVFYEMLGGNMRKPIDHMWFSVRGRYTRIKKAANTQYGENTDEVIKNCFNSFRRVYHSLDYSHLPITTGDAFAEYVSLFGLSEDISEETLIKNVKNCAPRFLPEKESEELSDPADVKTRLSLLSIFKQSSNLGIAFVFAGTPHESYNSAMHDVGRIAVERAFPHLNIKAYYTSPDLSDAYKVMSSAAEEMKPDILFSTDKRLTQTASRIALEARRSLILQCGSEKSRLSTYYGNTAKPPCLCGILASSLSETGAVGFIPARASTGVLPHDMQAFAHGAKILRPNIRVCSAVLSEHNTKCRKEAIKRLFSTGCDIAYLPVLPYDPLEIKFFPGMTARLCKINERGCITDILAAAAWHWDAFYEKIIGEILNGSGETLYAMYEKHFRMGFSVGLLKVHRVFPENIAWPEILFSQAEKLLSTEEILPLRNEPYTDIVEV